MPLHFLIRCVLVLRSSAIFFLVVGGLSSAAHAQNYGWATSPAYQPSYQPYRPYASPYAAPYSYRDEWNSLASLQAVPTNQTVPSNRQQSNYPQPAQASSVQSVAGYENGPSAYGCDSCGCDSCGIGAACCQPCGPYWGGYAGGLFLSREDENHRFFSFDSTNEAYQLLDSQDSNFDDGFGAEVHLIRRNPCCGTAWEGVYWGIYPEDSFAYAYPSQVAGTLNGIFNFDQLNYNGASANNNVNGAMVHRLRRETEIHNVELNHLWELSPRGGSSSPWTFQALAGFRYFRFVDNLEFASDTADTVFTGAAQELYYTIDVDNDLYGFQLGGLAERQSSRHSRWSLLFGAKVGAFINDAEAHSRIGGSAGTATINNGPNNGLAFDITSDKNDLALLAELQAGVAYQIGRHWRLRGEYRVLGVSGVALPTNQIYQDLRGLQDVQFLATNGDLILHGAFFGAELAY